MWGALSSYITYIGGAPVRVVCSFRGAVFGCVALNSAFKRCALVSALGS